MVALTSLCNLLWKLIEALPFNAPIASVFHTVPAVMFTVVGYFVMLVARHCHLHMSRLTSIIGAVACMAVTGMVDYFVIKSHGPVNGLVFNLHHMTTPDPFSMTITGLFGSLAVILFCRALPRKIKWLASLGKRSLHIMVFHSRPMPLYIPLVMLSDAVFGQSFCFIVAVLLTLVSYWLAVLWNSILKRIPVIR